MKKVSKTNVTQSYQVPVALRKFVASITGVKLSGVNNHFPNGTQVNVLMVSSSGLISLKCVSNGYSSLTSSDSRFKGWFFSKGVGCCYFVSITMGGVLVFN
jgi:hypothetical protein